MRKRELLDGCSRLRRHIEIRRLATAAEIEKYWPTRGRAAPLGDWVRCFAQMTRLAGRQEYLRPDSEYASAIHLKILRDDPEPVQLVDGEIVHVYPKSIAVLDWFELQAWWIGWLSARVAALQQEMDEYEARKAAGKLEHDWSKITAPLAVLEESVQEATHRTALLVWVACHPGPELPWPWTQISEPWSTRFAAALAPVPERWRSVLLDLAKGLPFPRERTPLPHMDDVPEPWRVLHPLDITQIMTGFRNVNVNRLRFLPRSSEGRPVGVAKFYGSLSAGGRPLHELMMKESMSSQIAAVVLRNQSAEEASQHRSTAHGAKRPGRSRRRR